MILDPNEIWLGTEAATANASIHIAEADFDIHDDTDTLDLSTATEHWKWETDYSSGRYTLTDVSAGGIDLVQFNHSAPHIRLLDDVTFNGEITGVNVADDIVQFSALGGNAGDASTLQFRATSSDLDEIFEFDRYGNSDYDMYLHRGGSRTEVMTDSHDVLREGDAPYPEVENNGADVHAGPSILDFGDDITASDQGSGEVLIEYSGGTVPGRVHDDGTEILTDANGLDFLDHLDVSIDSNNNFAQITVNDSAFGTLANDETVAGSWTFDAATSFGAAITVSAADSHLEFHESDTAEADYWKTEISGGSFNVAFYDDSAATTTNGLAIDSSQNVDAPNGELSEMGNRVATRTFLSSQLAPYADTTETETISAVWTHESDVSLTADNQLQFGGGNWEVWHSTSNNNLYVNDDSGSTPTTIAAFSGTGVNFPQGASVAGNAVATETWVGSNYTSPSVSETITAQWSFDQQIQGEAATAALATDANALGGNGPSYYAALSEAESITGGWTFDSATTFNNAVTVNADLTHQSRVEVREDPDSDTNDAGLEIDVSANSVYIAPYDYTIGNYDANKQIAYDADGAQQWNIEGSPQAGGETIATETWVQNNVDTGGNVNSDQQETITAQWTFDAAPALPSGFTATASSGLWSNIDAQNNDVKMWHIGNGTDEFGYSLEYVGTGSGNQNYLRLWTDNETSADDIMSFEVTQDGIVDFKQGVEEGGNALATETWVQNSATASDAAPLNGYEIQVNGSDGTGVINFKTA